MKSKFFSFFRKKPLIIVSAVLFILLAAAGVAALLGVFGGDARDVTYTINPTSAQSGTVSLSNMNVKITALDSDSLGVSPTSAFTLVFDNPPEESEIASAIKVEPKQSYKLKKISRGEYNMTFNEPLAKDSIYRFTVSDKNTGALQSWAFQTKKSLNVVRSLPRNKGVQVPVNSGIEITFNTEKIENPEKYFEIAPKTDGRFEQHGKTLVFVPEKLEASTIYTVTIKSGIGVKDSSETLENDYTFSFQTIVPESETEKNNYFAFPDSLYSFTPQAIPAMQIYADEKLVDTEAALEIYSYPDADSFLKQLKSLDTSPSWAVSRDKSDKYDVSKLGKAATIKARIISYHKDYWNTTYLLLPASLPEGYYLVRAEIDGHYYYTQMQINPASVYLLAAKNKTLAWLNDSVTGSPLAGAEVMLDNGTPVKSDQDGLAVLNDKLPDTNDYQSFYFLVKPLKGNPFVAQIRSSPSQPYYGYYNSGVTDDYWTYLYLDKGIYMPEDTVNAWGVIKSRNGSDTGKEAVLELIRYDYSTNGDENVSVLTSSKVELSPNGTFTGSLRLSNYNPGSYEVRVKIGDKAFATNYIQIMDYTKPAYKLDITPDRNYMYAWETVNFGIQASFFEGTPVKGLKLDYNCSISGNSRLNSNTPENGSLVSDDSGASKLSVVPTSSEEGWRPQSFYLNVNNHEAEEQAISENSSVTVFPKDTMIDVKTNMEGTNGKISISTSRIDLEKLKDNQQGYYSEDQYRGASVDMPLTAKLYEKHYEKKKTGDYYDYINKVKRDTYEYYEVQSLVKDYSFSTVNGKYEINYTNEKDKSYFVEVYGKDSKNRDIKETQYVYNWNYYSPYSGNSTYFIAGVNYNKQYKEGENIPVEVKRTPVDNANTAASSNSSNGARYLFIRLKNGILDYTVKSDPNYSFEFKKDYIPNMYVKALCFDGSNIFDAGIAGYTYDLSASRLDLSVQADKEKYKPGDTVKLTFDVKDAEGRPSSSEVNISVVDEAFFTISPQNADTLSSLYGPAVSSGIVSDYLSYHSVDEAGSPMAEGGEGGDVYVRKDFRDSALFLTVKSDSSGKAEVSFKLPDNLTSWRVTYQAVTEDLKAGSGKMNITSKLPFFADTIFNKAFITGDSPSILVRANGTELAAAAKVNYTIVTTKEDGSSKTYKAAGSADALAEIQLDALSSGNYTIRVEAVSGNLKDALERTFTVSDSLLETSKTDYADLADSTVLSNGAKGLTSLVFYGEDSSLLFNELQDLYWSWGQRLDQKLANKIAGEMLKTNFNETIDYNDESFDIRNYQTEDGGLALLTYDSSNPALSAKLCSLAADYVDRAALVSYFNMLLNDSKTMPEDIAYAYWGLAALHEPVLLDIRSRLEAEGLTPQIRLILGTALSEIGDYQGARNIYDNVMKNSGKVEDTFAYIENGSRDESIDATAMCSLIALRINAPEKLKLFNYIKSNSTSELLVNLERLIFVKSYIKNASLDCSFNYELDGSKKQIDLKNGSYYRLTVTPEKLAAMKFSNVQGKVIAASTYVAPVSEIRSSGGSTISLQRTYEANGAKGVTEFDRSGTIRITITPKFNETAPDGFYEITDVLPAGFRYVANDPGKDGRDWYPDEVTGQKVVFGYYYNKANFKKGSIVYSAKAVSPGTYTADNAAIRYVDSSLTGFTEKLKIKVKK